MVKKKISLNSTINQLKANNELERSPNSENKLSLEENKNIIIRDIKANINDDCTSIKIEEDLRSLYINNWTIFCFWFTSKKKNINKILFEEGNKIITERLDIMNMFNHLYINEIIQEKLGIEAKDMEMSDDFKNSLHLLNSKTIVS